MSPTAHAWLDEQTELMVDRIITLAAINSGTQNQAGVEKVAGVVTPWLDSIADAVTRVALPSVTEIDESGREIALTFADALVARCRPDAPHQVLLSIHLDTVYQVDHPFQHVARPDANTLHGPGVADAKGGLVVMLAALGAFEMNRTDATDRVGWTVLLNPDEETGSLASVDVLHQFARQADFGLVYEPSLPDGTLIGQRKGSGNFTIVVRGRAAHAGREFAQGRNAVAALCRLLTKLESLSTDDQSRTLNLGRIVGGGPVNIVADLAVGRFNLRVTDDKDATDTVRQIQAWVDEVDDLDGFSATLHGRVTSPPKPLDEPSRQLLDRILESGREIGLELTTKSSGGVCDGNKLAAAGLPNIDTLGPRGGQIHSDQEYCQIDSLVERAKLTLGVLERFAQSPDQFPTRENRKRRSC